MTNTEAEEALAYQLTTKNVNAGRETKIPIYGKGLNYAKVDFLIDGWLVVEVDGPSHDKKQKQFDQRKDNALRLMSFQVLRVKNAEVFAGTAIGRILNALRTGTVGQKRFKQKQKPKPKPLKPGKAKTPELYVRLPSGKFKFFPTREAYENWRATQNRLEIR